MISIDEALACIDTSAGALTSENIALDACSGRVLAAPLAARMPAPRHAVAAMDGYAVSDATTQAGDTLRIVGKSRAGRGALRSVEAGEAVRIFAGAPMPEGTDRCIMQEHAERDGDLVRIGQGYGPGWHVHGAASDFAAGDILLNAGTLLSPRMMVVAAAADQAMLPVYARPRVALIGTGDELATPGTAYQGPDFIPESVTYGIAAMARQSGADVVSCTTGRDNLSALGPLAGNALDSADLVVVTGGASVGEHDFAKEMFAPHGLELVFSKVAMKPGKPVWFGTAKSKLVLGLPGNPTSAMVTGRLFLVALLAKLQGQAISDVVRWQNWPLEGSLPPTGDRETLARASLGNRGLCPVCNQTSGSQLPLRQAEWLIRCRPGDAARGDGDIVSAIAF